jgi:hypothetical protein
VIKKKKVLIFGIMNKHTTNKSTYTRSTIWLRDDFLAETGRAGFTFNGGPGNF